MLDAQLYGQAAPPRRVTNYRWLYDADPQVALGLRSDFQLRHQEARLRVAQLLAAGPESGLARVEELYCSLRREARQRAAVNRVVPHPRADGQLARAGGRRRAGRVSPICS